MGRLIIATAVVVAASAPAFAQPPTDWTKPVTGIDASPIAAAETTETIILIADPYKNHIEPIVIDPVITPAADTPLPPPCEPPLRRSSTTPPGPPTPEPAPCHP
jgi:hypothetical protein